MCADFRGWNTIPDTCEITSPFLIGLASLANYLLIPAMVYEIANAKCWLNCSKIKQNTAPTIADLPIENYYTVGVHGQN